MELLKESQIWEERSTKSSLISKDHSQGKQKQNSIHGIHLST